MGADVKFLVQANGESWEEEFRDEASARANLVLRGFRNVTVVPITDAELAERARKAAALADLKEKDPCAYAIETGDWSEVPLDQVEQAARRIVLTTGFFVAGAEIEKELEIITAECAYGMNLFRDFFASVRDIVGGRSGAVQKVLRDARRTVLAELKREALIVKADAVIGVDLDYQELGGAKSILLVASGTAVKLKRVS